MEASIESNPLARRESPWHRALISNRNVPTQRAMDLGLFRIKETTVTHADGHTTVSRTPKVTGKGKRYFIDRYWGRTQPSLEAGA